MTLYDTGNQKNDTDWARKAIQKQLIDSLIPPSDSAQPNQHSSA